MTLPLWQVKLQDEFPRIGSGERLVFVKEGLKWAFILCPYTATVVRTSMGKWRVVKRKAKIWNEAHTRSQSWLGRAIHREGRRPTKLEKLALSGADK
jgi:hypothetical protein